MKGRIFPMAVALAVVVFGSMANAGTSIGVFSWNLAPYNDVINLEIERRLGGYMSACGDEHASGAYRVPVHGAIVYEEYLGVYLLDFTFHSAATGTLWHYAALIVPGSLDGFWIDDTGDGGDFIFLGPGPQRGKGDGKARDSQ